MTHQEKLLVDWRGLKALGIPFCRAHVYRMMEAGTFPQSIKLGAYRGSRIVWMLQDILNWLEAHRQR